MSARGPPRGGKGRSYRRPPGCVSRAAGRLDEYVAAVINARLARPDAADLLAPRGSAPDLSGLRRRAADLRELLNEQARLHAPRRHRRPAARGREHRAALRAQRRRGRLAAVIRRERLDPIAGRPDAAALWQTLDLGRQRAVVTVLCTVTLGPGDARPASGRHLSRHQPPRDSVHLAPVNRARSCVSASTTGLTAASVPMRSAPRTALHPAAI